MDLEVNIKLKTGKTITLDVNEAKSLQILLSSLFGEHQRNFYRYGPCQESSGPGPDTPFPEPRVE